MYTVYIAPIQMWIMIGAVIFVTCVLWWTGHEFRRDIKKEREIDMLEAAWDLTEDLDEDEIDEEFERNG